MVIWPHFFQILLGKTRFYIMIAYNTESGIVCHVEEFTKMIMIGIILPWKHWNERDFVKSDHLLDHHCMKTSQSIWCLCSLCKWNIFILRQLNNTIKRFEENYSDWLLDDKVTVKGFKAEKVHFTSQTVKIILCTNFNSWENTVTFNIKDLRCYPTMFPGGTGGHCISVQKYIIQGTYNMLVRQPLVNEGLL